MFCTRSVERPGCDTLFLKPSAVLCELLCLTYFLNFHSCVQLTLRLQKTGKNRELIHTGLPTLAKLRERNNHMSQRFDQQKERERERAQCKTQNSDEQSQILDIETLKHVLSLLLKVSS